MVLYHTRMKQAEQLQAIAIAMQAVTSGLDLEAVLQQIVESSRGLVQARYAALGVLNEAGDAIEQFITAGIDDAVRSQIGPYPQGRGLLGHIIQSRQPLRIADMAHHPRAAGFPPHHPPMTSLLGVPIVSKGRVFGNLYLTDKVGELAADAELTAAHPFTADDQALVELFAQQAAIAIENALLHRRSRQLAVAQERERFAMDLHDGIIQSIYGVGLTLDESRYQLDLDPDQSRAGIDQAIHGLNDVIADIRNYILNLRTQRFREQDLATGLESLSREVRAHSFLNVQLDLETDALEQVNDIQTRELLHIAQEALANTRKHAGASAVTVRFSQTKDSFELCIEDNGRGFENGGSAGDRSGDGLRNMSARAQALGGRVRLVSSPAQGTSVIADVPKLPPLAPEFT